jgi:hypothetical protein
MRSGAWCVVRGGSGDGLGTLRRAEAVRLSTTETRIWEKVYGTGGILSLWNVLADR